MKASSTKHYHYFSQKEIYKLNVYDGNYLKYFQSKILDKKERIQLEIYRKWEDIQPSYDIRRQFVQVLNKFANRIQEQQRTIQNCRALQEKVKAAQHILGNYSFVFQLVNKEPQAKFKTQQKMQDRTTQQKCKQLMEKLDSISSKIPPPQQIQSGKIELQKQYQQVEWFQKVITYINQPKMLESFIQNKQFFAKVDEKYVKNIEDLILSIKNLEKYKETCQNYTKTISQVNHRLNEQNLNPILLNSVQKKIYQINPLKLDNNQVQKEQFLKANQVLKYFVSLIQKFKPKIIRLLDQDVTKFIKSQKQAFIIGLLSSIIKLQEQNFNLKMIEKFFKQNIHSQIGQNQRISRLTEQFYLIGLKKQEFRKFKLSIDNINIKNLQDEGCLQKIVYNLKQLDSVCFYSKLDRQKKYKIFTLVEKQSFCQIFKNKIIDVWIQQIVLQKITQKQQEFIFRFLQQNYLLLPENSEPKLLNYYKTKKQLQNGVLIQTHGKIQKIIQLLTNTKVNNLCMNPRQALFFSQLKSNVIYLYDLYFKGNNKINDSPLRSKQISSNKTNQQNQKQCSEVLGQMSQLIKQLQRITTESRKQTYSTSSYKLENKVVNYTIAPKLYEDFIEKYKNKLNEIKSKQTSQKTNNFFQQTQTPNKLQNDRNQSEIYNLRNETAKYKKQYDELYAETKGLKQQNYRLKTDSHILFGQIQTQNKAMLQKQQELNQIRNTLNELKQKVDVITEQLDKKSKQSQSNHNQIVIRDQQLKDVKQEFKTQGNLLKTKDQELKTKQKQLQINVKQLEQKQKEKQISNIRKGGFRSFNVQLKNQIPKQRKTKCRMQFINRIFQFTTQSKIVPKNQHFLSQQILKTRRIQGEFDMEFSTQKRMLQGPAFSPHQKLVSTADLVNKQLLTGLQQSSKAKEEQLLKIKLNNKKQIHNNDAVIRELWQKLSSQLEQKIKLQIKNKQTKEQETQTQRMIQNPIQQQNKLVKQKKLVQQNEPTKQDNWNIKNQSHCLGQMQKNQQEQNKEKNMKKDRIESKLYGTASGQNQLVQKEISVNMNKSANQSQFQGQLLPKLLTDQKPQMSQNKATLLQFQTIALNIQKNTLNSEIMIPQESKIILQQENQEKQEKVKELPRQNQELLKRIKELQFQLQVKNERSEQKNQHNIKQDRNRQFVISEQKDQQERNKEEHCQRTPEQTQKEDDSQDQNSNEQQMPKDEQRQELISQLNAKINQLSTSIQESNRKYLQVNKKYIKALSFQLQHSQLNEQNERIKQIQKKLKNQVVQLMSANESGRKQMAENLKMKVQQQKMLFQMQQKLRRISQQFSQKLQEKQREISGSKNKLDELQSVVNNLEEQKFELNARIGDVQQGMKEAQDQTKDLNTKLRNAQNQAAELKKRHQEEINKFKISSSKQMEQLKRTVKNMEHSLKNSKKNDTEDDRFNLPSSQIRQYKLQNNKLKGEIDRQKADSRKTLEYNNKEISGLNIQIQDLKQTLKSNQDTIKRLKTSQNRGVYSKYTYDRFFNSKMMQEQYQKKFQLLNLIQQKCPGRKVKQTRLIYHFDQLNPTNFHSYVDYIPNLLVVVRTQKNIFGAFSTSKLQRNYKQNSNNIAFIYTFNPNLGKPITAFDISYKKDTVTSLTYDEYYLIVGNSQIRLKSGEKRVYSNFGIQNGFYCGENAKVDALLMCGVSREAQILGYQCYEVVFADNKDKNQK